MARMQREMDRVFENFWNGDWAQNLPEFPFATFQPFYNVEDKGSHFLLTKRPALRMERPTWLIRAL
jgi:hypothetical protein